MSEDLKRAARAATEKSREDLVELSHRIHAEPELGYEEQESAAAVAEMLAGAGFEVENVTVELPSLLRAMVVMRQLRLMEPEGRLLAMAVGSCWFAPMVW